MYFVVICCFYFYFSPKITKFATLTRKRNVKGPGESTKNNQSIRTTRPSTSPIFSRVSPDWTPTNHSGRDRKFKKHRQFDFSLNPNRSLDSESVLFDWWPAWPQVGCRRSRLRQDKPTTRMPTSGQYSAGKFRGQTWKLDSAAWRPIGIEIRTRHFRKQTGSFRLCQDVI